MKQVWTPVRKLGENANSACWLHLQQQEEQLGDLDYNMTEALRNKIREFILENFLFTDDTSAIALDDSLLERGVVDSTGMLEIVMFIEEQLGVRVMDEEMIPENLDSVNNIAKFVECKNQAA